MGEVRDGRAETVAQRATKLVLQWPGREPAAAPLRCDKRSADPYMSGSPVRPRGPGGGDCGTTRHETCVAISWGCDKKPADPYMSESPVRPRGPGTMFHVEVPWFPQTHGCPSFLLNII